jgi:hypothetical protein
MKKSVNFLGKFQSENPDKVKEKDLTNWLVKFNADMKEMQEYYRRKRRESEISASKWIIG